MTVMTSTKQGKRWRSRGRKILEKGIKSCIRWKVCQTLHSGSSRDMTRGNGDVPCESHPPREGKTTMKNLTPQLRKWALLSIGVATLVVAVGAGSMKIARQYFVLGPAATDLILLPGGAPQFNSDLARLNTRTGAVYRYRGELDNTALKSTWEMRVPPVTEETSGVLEIQRIALPKTDARTGETDVQTATFLVDIVNGTTWVLREMASTNARWQLVNVFH